MTLKFYRLVGKWVSLFFSDCVFLWSMEFPFERELAAELFSLERKRERE